VDRRGRPHRAHSASAATKRRIYPQEAAPRARARLGQGIEVEVQASGGRSPLFENSRHAGGRRWARSPIGDHFPGKLGGRPKTRAWWLKE